MKKYIKGIMSVLVCLMMVIGLSQDVDAASLKIKSITTSCGSSVEKGKTIKLTAKATGGTGTKTYKFRYKYNNKMYTIKNYSQSQSVSFKPTKTGTYQFYVYVKDKKRTVYKTKTVKVVTPYTVSLSTSGKYVNENIKLTAKTTGGTGTKQFKFTYKYNGKTYTIKKYSKTSSVSFKPTKTGTYVFYVTSQDTKKKTKTTSQKVVVSNRPLSLTMKTSATQITIGQTVKMSASSTGGVGTKQYQYTYKYNNKTYTIAKYSTKTSVSFKPTKVGTYQFITTCKDKQNKVVSKSTNVQVKALPELKTSLSVTGKYAHEKITLSASSTNGTGTKQYKFTYIYNDEEYLLQDYSTKTSVSFQTEDIGQYQLFVYCQDAQKKIATDTTTIQISEAPQLELSLTITGEYINETVQIDAQASGGGTTKQYRYVYYVDDEKKVIKDYSSQTSVTFTPTQEAKDYVIEVECQDSTGQITTQTVTKTFSLNPARKKVVDVAKGWLGCNEKDGSHKKIIDIYNNYKHASSTINYKVKYTDAWCDTFVSACFIKAGYASISGTECGCQRHIDNILKKKGIWEEDDGYTPQVGDIIFYHGHATSCQSKGDCTDNSNHVGLVVEVNGTDLKIIEGNYDDSVKYRTIQVNDSIIRGYGVPQYPS